MTENVLDLALEAFWAKVAELHPERESGDLSPGTAYDLELWCGKAYEEWLEVNKPVYYVQRTMVQVVKIMGAESPEDAEGQAADIDEPTWFSESLDTSCEYITLDRGGKQCC